MQDRKDDYQTRRKHLAGLSEEALEQRFWELARQLTSPMIDMARTHSSPSIERSVLLRMGFSSLEARSIVEEAVKRGLIAKGAGHLVLRCSRATGNSLREAGLALARGEQWEICSDSFAKGGSHGTEQ